MDRLPAKHPEWAPPPFHVMVARDHEGRGGFLDTLQESQATLELAVPAPLACISGHQDRIWLQLWQQPFQGPDLLQIHRPTKVQIGEVDEGELAHQEAWIR
jgi:hypothetical protein